MSGTLYWTDGDSEPKTFVIPIANDRSAEPVETFSVQLTSPVNAFVGRPQITVSIRDDDPTVVTFASPTYSVDEGDAVTVTVTRTGSGGAARVDWITYEHTASRSDFVTRSGTLEWPAGDSSPRTFTIETRDDAEPENDETFTLNLIPQVGTTGGSPATVTIRDDERPWPGTLRPSPHSYRVDEGAGTVSITVERAFDAAGDVSVNYATSPGTATAADFTSVSGTLRWANGDSAPKTFAIPITDDPTIERDETFSVTLSSPTGGAVAEPYRAEVTIINNDVPPAAGAFQFSSPAYDATEGSGRATITVMRIGGSSGAVSVDYTTVASGSAGAADFTMTSGTLHWADGDAVPKTFIVPIIDDATPEATETFAVQLSSPAGGVLGLQVEATVTVADEDLTSVRFSSAAYEVSEGDQLTITLLRSAPGREADVSSRVLQTGTATVPDLASSTMGGVTWKEGDGAPKTFTVPTREDSEVEGDETFVIELYSPTGTAIEHQLADVTIVDDEPRASMLTVQFERGSYSVPETAGKINVAVTRTGSSTGIVTANFMTSPGSAGRNDFISTSGLLVWPNGDTTPRSITINITDDPSSEGNETFEIELLPDQTSVPLGTPPSATITIIDNEPPPIRRRSATRRASRGTAVSRGPRHRGQASASGTRR